MTGFFITVEGGDGAGKTTHLDFINHWLKQKGLPVIVTREPGGTEIGEAIRGMLLDGNQGEMSDSTELLLVFAARMQHVDEVIRPALQQGKSILCDRFTDATYAYQGGGRGIGMDRIAQLERWVQEELQPDLTIVLDVPVETGLQRTRQRGEAADRFERQSLDFKKAVRQCYLDRAEQFPHRIKLIDASRKIEQVQHSIARELDAFYKTRAGSQRVSQ